MQTNFSLAQLADPHIRESEKILRSCVHCGFCTATCPTYLLLGDELDSPRGRIYLIKDMLENGKPATQEIVKHIDRCLSCLSCMTTCPSGVHYMHLVDHARSYIEKTYVRDLRDRFVRALLAHVLPYRGRFRLALSGASIVQRLLAMHAAAHRLIRLPAPGDPHTPPREMTRTGLFRRLGAMIALAPERLPSRAHQEELESAAGDSTRRVALLTGCAQAVLAPSINEAAVRFLRRHGVEVVFPAGEGCCGALVHHMGRDDEALAFARHNIDVWTREIEKGLDAILITASGCGTTIKDYGFMLRDDPAYAEKAARVSALAKDITEYIDTLGLEAAVGPARLTIAYHSACSMQHGQRLGDVPKRLLRSAGFKVKDVPEGHICCGSAGTYNILQPGLATALRHRKLANIAKTRPDAVATGNIGCISQLAPGTTIPIVHTIELLDWAAGGPRPAALPATLGDSAPAGSASVDIPVERALTRDL
jgi:glycolate oxidase iron-sulfur subunit